MKKIVCVLVLACLVMAAVFAQDSGSNIINWISGEASLFGAGARYEYMLSDKLSVGGNIYWSSVFFIFNEFELGGSVRYYPFEGKFKDVYAGAGLGFHTQTGIYKFKYDYTKNGIRYTGEASDGLAVSGIAITPEIGWKFDVGNPGGFFVSPGIKLPITFGELGAAPLSDFDSSIIKDRFRVVVGVVIYCGLGYAF